MAKRKKRKRRGHYEPRATKAEAERATIAKEALRAREGNREPLAEERLRALLEGREPAPANAIDLLRADQDNPPVVVR